MVGMWPLRLGAGADGARAGQTGRVFVPEISLVESEYIYQLMQIFVKRSIREINVWAECGERRRECVQLIAGRWVALPFRIW